MPCVSRLANGSANSTRPEVAHHARPEARIQQVQDGVLDAADVLIHRQPVVGARIDHRRVVVGAGDSAGNTRTNRRRYPWCRFRAARRRRTSGQLHSKKRGVLASGLPLPSGTRSSGSTHRQILVRHRHVAAGGAVDDRDRAAPVALARDAPVAQALLHVLRAQALAARAPRRWHPRPPRKSSPANSPEFTEHAVLAHRRPATARARVVVGAAGRAHHRA